MYISPARKSFKFHFICFLQLLRCVLKLFVAAVLTFNAYFLKQIVGVMKIVTEEETVALIYSKPAHEVRILS